MKTFKIDDKAAGIKNVFLFKSLAHEAQEKARDWFRSVHDDPMMQSHMINLLAEALSEAGFTVQKYGQELDVRYSLSHCQGDGFSFIGDLERGGKRYKAVQSDPHYVHEYTMKVYEITEEGEELDAPEVTEECRGIARKMAEAGYSEIEYQNSAEYIDEAMEANEYTFTREGVRIDADTE